MATTVDNRIIQMQFDNAQFEKNIAKSQKSIEELKEAMDFDETSRGLQRFTQSMDALSFGNLTTNIQRLTDKFTGLGDAGEYVLSRIRSGLEGAARSMEGFIKSISSDQISVGQSKYDALNKSVMTIISSGKYTEEEAYSVMERVMAYTDQTSHSFETMVGQISALQSIGMDLSGAERFLEGVANAATKAGAGAAEAAGAMSIISKIMGGSSFLGKQQFDSLNQTYHIVTSEWRDLAIEAGLAAKTLEKKGDKVFTAKSLGKQVEVTAATLENTLSQRWFTGDVAKNLFANYQFGKDINELKHPEDVMDSFGKTAYLTGQRALTFADALNAIKESVSSGWMDTFRIVLGDVTEAAETFTNICDRVIESLETIKKFRNDLFRSWEIGGGKNSMLDILLGDYWRETETGAVGFMDLLDGLGKVVYTGFRDFLLLFASPADRYVAKQDPKNFAIWLGARLAEITEKVQKFMQGIKGFFNEEIDVNGETKTRLEVIYDIVHGISGALGFAYMILKGVSNFMMRIGTQLKPSFDTIIGFFGDLGDRIFGAAQETAQNRTIFDFFDDLAAKAEPLTSGINQIIASIGRLLRTLLGLDKEGDGTTDTLTAIGDTILYIADIVGKTIGPVLTFVSDLIGLFADLASGKINFEGFITGIGGSFSKMFGTFTSYIPEDMIPDWAKHLFGIGLDETEAQGETFFDKVRRFFETNFSSFDTLLKNITSGFSLKSALESGFGFLSAFNFLNTVAGWFKTTNLYGIILAFLGVASLATLFNLLMNARKAIRTIGGFFDDVGGSLKAGFLGEYEWNSEKIKNFATGILMIAGSIAMLGSMDRGALIQGAVVVGLIFAALFLLTKHMENMKGTYVQQLAAVAIIDSIAAAVTAIVLSLSILMLAMIPLASDWKRMLAAFLGFAAILGSIGAFIVIMVKQLDHFMVARMGGNSWAQIGKLAAILFLIAGATAILALSVGALMVAMTPLAAMGWQNVLAAVGGLALILTSIGAFIIIMLNAMDKFVSTIGGGTTSWGGIAKAAVMMVLLAGTVAILSAGISALVVALAPLAAIGFKGIMSAVLGLGLILTEIGLFMMIMLNSMDQFAFNVGGGKTGPAGIAKMAALMLVLTVSVALLSVSIGLLITAITPLALMSVGGVAKAVAGLGVILLELGLFMNYVSKMNGGEGASVKLLSFAGFAFSIGVLVMALTPLALMDWGGWGRAMIGLTIVLGELIGAMKLMQIAKVSTVSLAAFAGFAASIGILIFALQPLAGMDWGGWGRAMIGLMIVLGELIGAMKLMDALKVNTGSLFGFIGFALSIAILIFALKPLAEMDTEGYTRAMVGLATVMLEVVVFLEILKEMKPDLASAGSALLILIGLGASMILFGIAFNEVKDVPWQNIVGFAAGISVLLVAIAGASALAKAGGIKGMLILVVGLAAVIGVLALMAPLLIKSIGGALTDLSSNLVLISNLMQSFSGNMNGVDEGNIDKGKRVIDKLKEMFKGLFGFALVSNSVTSFTQAIAQLNLMSDQLSIFSGRIGKLSNDGGVDKFKRIVGKIKSLVSEELSGFGAFQSQVNSFDTIMYQLGTAAGTFEFNTKSVGDPEQNNGLKTILSLAGAASELDTVSKLNLDDLTAKMSGLGGAMMLYAMGAEEVGTLEVGKTPDVTAAVALMQAISTSLNENGGFTIPSDMPDEQSLSLFGASLAALAGALVKFEQAGSGLGEGTEKALEVIGFFQRLKTKLEATSFFSNLGYLITNGGDSLQDKTSELTTFGNNISQLAQSMGQFAASTTYLDQETGEVKTYDYSNAISAMESIAGIATKLPSFDGAIDIIIGKRESLTTFAGEIELLGSSLKGFHTNTTVMDEVNKNPPEFDYTNAIGALESIAAIPGKMPMTPGLIPRLWKGNPPSLTELATDIIKLGGSLNEFGKSVTAKDEEGNLVFDPTVVTPALGALDEMVDFMSRIPTKLDRVGGLKGMWESITIGRPANMDDISSQVGKLGDGLGKLGAGLMAGGSGTEGATPFSQEMVQPAIQAVDDIITFMQTMHGKLDTVGGLVNILDTVLNGREVTMEDIGTQVGKLGDGLGKLGQGLTTGNWNSDTSDMAKNAFGALDSVLGMMLKVEQLRGMTGNAYAGLDALTYFVEGLTEEQEIDGIKHMQVVDHLVNFMTYFNQALVMLEDDNGNLDLVKDRLEVFRIFAEGLNQLSNSNFSESFDWSYIGTTLTTSVASSITTGITNVTDAFHALLVAINTEGTIHPGIDWTAIGSAISSGVITGISGGTEGVTQAAHDIAIAAYNAAMAALDAHSPSKVFTDVGSYIGLGMVNGINMTSDDVVNATEDTVSAIMGVVDKDTIGNWMNDIFNRGNVDLLSRPLVDAQKLIQAGWEDVGEGLATVFTSTYTAGKGADYEWNKNVIVDFTPITPDGQVLSPEELEDYAYELFAQSGNIDELLANDSAANGGLNLLINVNSDFSNFEEGLEKAESKMVLLHQLQEGYYLNDEPSKLNNISGFVSTMSQIMAESIDVQPTITPVLDMSQVEAGLSRFGFGQYGGTIGIDTTVSSRRAGHIGQDDQNGSEPVQPDYSGIYERMAQLGEQIQGMNTAISNMKLVLDTGVIAGGVTNGVDRNIGRRQFYANRNNGTIS